MLIGMVIVGRARLGPAATIAILLPITYTINPLSAIFTALAGIYYGAQVRAAPSVLLRHPARHRSVDGVDGFALAKRARPVPRFRYRGDRISLSERRFNAGFCRWRR